MCQKYKIAGEYKIAGIIATMVELLTSHGFATGQAIPLSGGIASIYATQKSG